MPATYEPIATTTLGSAAADITFSSIPSTYTDLKLIITGTSATNTVQPRLQFNSDTATNYSNTSISGNGTAASSTSQTSAAYMRITPDSTSSSTIPVFYNIDIFSYTGSTYKTCLLVGSADLNGSGFTQSSVGLWRSTSAITTIKYYMSSGNLNSGTTATLYGIKSA